MRHETGQSVVMNCASHSDGNRTFLVAGQESHCQLYHVSMEVIDIDSEDVIKSKNGNILKWEYSSLYCGSHLLL